jgi:hypothetical protein
MAKRDEIKKVILDIAGNPESGVVNQLADAWAEAIAGLDSAPVTGDVPEKNEAAKPAKEMRVTKITEVR